MKRFFSIILTLIIVMSTLSISVTAVTSDSTEEVVSSKINDVLKEKMNEYTDDEYIPVYVWLQDIGDSAVYDVLSKKLGAEISSTNEQSYIEARVKEKLESYKEIISEKESILSEEVETVLSLDTIKDISAQIKDIRTQAGISSIMTDSEIKICIEEGMDIEKIIELSEQNQFLSDWRSTRKTVNGVINTAFEAKLDEGQCRNIYIDPALPYAELECKKSYITTLATITEVTEIGYYEEVELVDDIESEIETEIITEEIASTQSANANGHIVSGNYLMTPHEEAMGLTGAGVRIGVLEGNPYNKNNPHLATANITLRNSTDSTESTVDISHSTKVLSIICGQPIAYNGTTYQGIALNADVFFATSPNRLEDKICLDWFVNTCNVSVINMSFGYPKDENGNLKTKNFYEGIDQYIDCYIQQYRIVIVKSASNNSGNVTSPGFAYNAITVGNVSNDMISGMYEMNSSSSYLEDSYLANKPDISAYGTKITMLQTSKTTWSGSGTSFSAPMVTGTVALMLQANPCLLGKPDTVKAILMTTALQDEIYKESVDTNKCPVNIYNTSHISAEGQLYNRSGAGLLNIKGALQITFSEKFIYRFEAIAYDSAEEIILESPKIYFGAGQTIDLGLVFEKATHEILTAKYATDFNVQVLDENDVVLMETTSDVNNVELFKCTFKVAGVYKIRIVCEKLAIHDTDEEGTPPFNFEGDSIHTDHIWLYLTLVICCECNMAEYKHNGSDAERTHITCGNSNCAFDCYEYYRTVTCQFVSEVFDTNKRIIVDNTIYYQFSSLALNGTYELTHSAFTRVGRVVDENGNELEGYTMTIIGESGSSELQTDGTYLETREFRVTVPYGEGEYVSYCYTVVYKPNIYYAVYHLVLE